LGGALRFIIVALIAMGALLFILSEVLKFSKSIFGFNRRLASDIKSLRKTIEKRQEELVPLDLNELKLLSGDVSSHQNIHRLEGQESNVLKSVYDESLGVVAHKFYEELDQGVLVLKLLLREWVFVYNKGETKIFQNGKHRYTFSENQLKNKDSSQVLLTLERGSDTIIKLMSKGNHLASIDTDESDSEFSKILSYCDPTDKTDEDYILLAVVFYLFEID
jgi:hypothetical protein